MRREREARDRPNARPPKRASERRSFDALKKPISSASPRTRPAGGSLAANRRPRRPSRANCRRRVPPLVLWPAEPRGRGRGQAIPAARRARPDDPETRRADAAPGTRRRQRNRGRLTVASATAGDDRTDAFGRVLPSTHAASQGPQHGGAKGENRARNRSARGDHDPGALEPHV